jgi:cytidylate kinase
MKKHIIVLGGLPGSGKSTVKEVLAESLGYSTFSTGDFARKLAIDRGLTLEAFNELVATTKDLDLLIDAELERIEAEEDNMVIDSHLAFHFVPSAFSVFLDLPLEESASRIFNDKDSAMRQASGDTMETYDEALERTTRRVENHKKRYMEHYGIDPYDQSKFDFVVDTLNCEPTSVAEAIINAYTTWVQQHTI